MIIGRETELGALRRYLDHIREGPSALIFEGVAGIGKTSLWLEALSSSREDGCLTLVTRAAESEARLSYSALSDLVDGYLDDTLPNLPEPQRRAMETALLRAAPAETAADPQAVSRATLGVVKQLASARPVMVAIDDLQWIDAPSARVISFAMRRLVDEPVGLLASVRVAPDSAGDPVGIDRMLSRVTHIDVGPLSDDSLGRLLRERTGVDLSRPVVEKLHRVCGGNPLFALEIARAMVRGGIHPELGVTLPVPEDLQVLLSARLASLAPSAHAALLAVAASSHPTLELVLAASGKPRASRFGLAKAEAAGIVERADGRIRFTHPLLASTVYLNATPAERRDLHLRLAEIVGDPEERARHLALAAEGPDPDVARALDVAGRLARSRGAPAAAAELADLALSLTRPEEIGDIRARSLNAAEYHFDAGDASEAQRVLREAIASTPPGPERAEVLFRLSGMSWMNLITGVRRFAEQAALEAGTDPELQSNAHMALAWVAFYLGDLDEAWRQAKESAGYAARLSGPGARADALATLGMVEFVRGRPAQALMTEAVGLQDLMMREGSWTEASVYTTPRSILGLELMWSGRFEEARDVFELELAEYERNAMYTVRQEVLCYLAELECRAGRWTTAARCAGEAMETVVESGQTATQSHVALFNMAMPAAYLGRVDDARRWATEGVRLAEENDDPFNASWNRAVLGFLELSLSDFERAHSYLEPVVRYLLRMAPAEPAIIPCIPDDVEALLATGDMDTAESLIGWLEERGRNLDRPWALAAAARCRGMLAAAQGEPDRARACLEEALREHERAGQPFERARSLLVLGRILRRAKQKRLARDSLQEAREVFAELGATLWEGSAETDLARIGGRPPNPLELTPTEQKVAHLVAEGQTNREVANELFISASTVQSNLKRIYAKFGVRSRTELAARIKRTRMGDSSDGSSL